MIPDLLKEQKLFLRANNYTVIQKSVLATIPLSIASSIDILDNAQRMHGGPITYWKLQTIGKRKCFNNVR